MTATPTAGTALSAMSQPQAGTLTVTPAVGTAVGDLVLIVCSVADSASANWTPSGGSGTWTTVIASPSIGTGKLFVLSKVFAAGDTTYTLTRSGSDAWRITPITITNWDPAYTPIVGALGTRAASGGTVNTTAPSITTLHDDSLVLYLGMERTNSNDGPVVIDNGFATVVDLHTVGGDNLQAVYVAQKAQAIAGAVGATTSTWTNAHGSNSGALLYAVASIEAAPPSTGQIGFASSTSPAPTTLTTGFKRLGGTSITVSAAGPGGPGDIHTATATIDATSGWSTATITGLTADTTYTVTYEVDGVEQTDVILTMPTLPMPGVPLSFTMVTGSCQFTASNHPIWDRIRERAPRVLGHMGDLHYQDSTTLEGWRAGVDASLSATRMRELLKVVPWTWTWDNHDRIITNPTGAGTGLNYGETDPQTNTEWRKLAGTDGWASPDTAGRSWVIGRVRFIQTDQWTVRDDADGDPSPRTFLGAAQKAWFKNLLDTATEEVIVWLCQWTGQNHTNGRWASFDEETTELEDFINARPEVKARMVMIGGDSHSLQVTDGTRTRLQGQRFEGIPNYNISGFNRSSDAGQGGAGWLIDAALRTTAQLEGDWGGYSLLEFDDSGDAITLTWKGQRVDAAGVEDTMWTESKTWAAPATGSATGSIDRSATAAGSKNPIGVSVAEVFTDALVEGYSEHEGTTTASISHSGSATGVTVRTGDATATVILSGTAAGLHRSEGSASGSIVVTGSADGGVGSGGEAFGDIVVDGSAFGSRSSSGSADASTTISATVAGGHSAQGSAGAEVVFSGSAAGLRASAGVAEIVIEVTGTAAGDSQGGGSATASVTYTASAAGVTPPRSPFPSKTRLISLGSPLRLVSDRSEVLRLVADP